MGRRAAVIRWLLTTVAVGLGLVMLVPPLAGYERYVVTGDSMGGAIERGSVVFARAVPVGALRVGDVITYTPPGRSTRVTHRIVWAGRGESGARAFRTRGDANRAADPWRFELDGPEQARVVGAVPYVGYVIAALSVRWVRMLFVGLPALLIAVAVLRELRAGEAAPA